MDFGIKLFTSQVTCSLSPTYKKLCNKNLWTILRPGNINYPNFGLKRNVTPWY
jgi:hypothetical protein